MICAPLNFVSVNKFYPLDAILLPKIVILYTRKEKCFLFFFFLTIERKSRFRKRCVYPKSVDDTFRDYDTRKHVSILHKSRATASMGFSIA